MGREPLYTNNERRRKKRDSTDDLAVLKFTPGPAVLIELGFISNEHDRNYLLVRENRIAVCGAILEVVRG